MNTFNNLALFDLDHTLLPLDSDYQWADFLARTGRAGDPAEAQRRNDDLMARYNAGKLSADEAAQFMLGLLARADGVDLAQWHEEFMQEIIRPSISEAAHDIVRWHQQQGDLCAIVTATNEFVTAPIARAFNIPYLIATTPQYRNGRYTGNIEGVASFQEGKIVRVNEWLASLGFNLSDFERSYFYSDSVNDLPLLEIVTHPIATNPSDNLREIAKKQGWKIVDLFEDMADAKS